MNMIKISKNNSKPVLLVLLGFLISCDAPRENPYDPNADNYQASVSTKITVHHLNNSSGIEDALLIEEKLGLSGRTDASGVKQWYHKETDSLLIIAGANGYFQDTTLFTPLSQNNNFDIYLNAKPQIEETNFNSIYFSYDDKTFIHMTAKITDTDGQDDIENVILKLRQDIFNDTLELDNSSVDIYQTSINIDDLPGNITPEALPELNFDLIVKNINGDSIASQPYSIKRVINETLYPLTPNSDSSATGNIVFTWQKVNLDFLYTYNVVLYEFSGQVKLIDVFKNISSDQNQYILDDPAIIENLKSGTHIWLLQVEDQLGNICLSEQLFFQYYK